MRSREIENIWGTRVILFGKKYRGVEKGGPRWCRYNVISNRPTFERIAASSVRGVSVRATFTLQWCYRISRRRCNRRCNLCLVFRTSAYGLRHMYMYTCAYVHVVHSTSAYLINLFQLKQMSVKGDPDTNQHLHLLFRYFDIFWIIIIIKIMSWNKFRGTNAFDNCGVKCMKYMCVTLHL